MKTLPWTLSFTAAALLFIGCGDTTSDDTEAGTDISVERGPLLYATVTDAAAHTATMVRAGVYRFDTAPIYPIDSRGGVIDVNRNGIVDEGDVIASNLRLRSPEGNVTTIVTSLAADADIQTMLKNDFNLTDGEIFGHVPSTDRRIAAISDEVYKYCTENNISDPSSLSLAQVQQLRTNIQARIETYETDTRTTAVLEEELLYNELNLHRLDTVEAQNISQRLEANAGSVPDDKPGGHPETVPHSEDGAASSSSHSYGNRPDEVPEHSSMSSSSAAAASSSSYGYGNRPDEMPEHSSMSSSSAAADLLSDEQKYTLAYMWNEEKLAKDIYLALNDVHPSQTLYNIATRAEVQHQASVEALVQAYDINITNLDDYTRNYSESELRAFLPGEFGIAKIQDLYDLLYAKGVQSAQDALEVGCMVEVTDINDLDEDIAVAQGIDDIVTVFTNLRQGSYNHYWAFDRALKNMGVADGCCVLGAEYCKSAEEYPSQNGSGGKGH